MSVLIVTADPALGERVSRLAGAVGCDAQVATIGGALPCAPASRLVVSAGLDCAAVAALGRKVALLDCPNRPLMLAIAPNACAPESLLESSADDCLPADFSDADFSLRLRVLLRRLSQAPVEPNVEAQLRANREFSSEAARGCDTDSLALAVEKRAREATARVAAIVACSVDAIITRDLDGRVATWNPAAERLYGYTAEEAIGTSHDLISDLAPTDPPVAFEVITEATGGYSRNFRQRHKDGTLVDLSATMFPLYDVEGENIGVAGITRDVTAAKLAEAELAGRARQQQALSALRESLSAAASEAEVFGLVMDSLAAVFEADRCSFRVSDAAAAARPAVISVRGLSEEFVEAVSASQELAAGAEGNAPYFFSSDSELLPPAGKCVLEEEGIVSTLVVPVLLEGSPIGQAAAYFPTERIFLAYESEFAGSAAAQAGFALERLRIQAELADSQALLSLTFDSADIGIAVMDNAGRFVRVNQGYSRILGYEVDELLGQHFSVARPPLAPGAIPEERHAIRTTGFPIDTVWGDWRAIRKDGTQILLAGTVSGFQREGHSYSVTTVADVTDQRATEKRAQRLARILSESPNEVYLFDVATLTVLDANPAALANLGYSLEQIPAPGRLDLLLGVTREGFDALVQPLLAGEVEQLSFEFERGRPDGSVYPVATRVFLSYAEESPVLLILAEDVTEKQSTEAALRSTQGYLEEVVDSAAIILFALDKDGLYTYYSGSALSKLDPARESPNEVYLFDVATLTVLDANPAALAKLGYSLGPIPAPGRLDLL
ncbi:MAG: PAS domain S-box protein, partial [Tepidiformaceae bacterium]